MPLSVVGAFFVVEVWLFDDLLLLLFLVDDLPLLLDEEDFFFFFAGFSLVVCVEAPSPVGPPPVPRVCPAVDGPVPLAAVSELALEEVPVDAAPVV